MLLKKLAMVKDRRRGVIMRGEVRRKGGDCDVARALLRLLAFRRSQRHDAKEEVAV